METKQQREIRETAETLIEDRGVTNALAWATHCATRDNAGFWRMVRNEIMRLGVMARMKP
jgi:hypothetical protein